MKGITLLEIARLAPIVSFAEAPQKIKRHTGKLTDQEKAFSEAVGNNTCELAEYVLADPSTRAIAWFSGWGNGIECVDRYYDNLDLSVNVPRVRDDHNPQKYRLRLATDVSVSNFDLNNRYVMQIWANEARETITRVEGPPPIWMAMGGSLNTGWYIKPTSAGSDHYRFVVAEGDWTNAVLVVGWNENRLEHRQNVDVTTGFDGHADRAYFMLFKWT